MEPQDTFSQLRQITEVGLRRVAKKTREKIKAMDKNTPNLWLRRVRWSDHLDGKDPPKLLASIQSVNGAEEVTLQGICESFERVANAAQETAVPSIVPQSALFEINRKEQGKKARKPFDSQMEPSTFQTYKGVWKQILCYLYRTQDWADEDRPAYRLTHEQGETLDALVTAVTELRELAGQRTEESPASQEEEKQQERVDRLCLQLCTRLLDHELLHTEYDSVILSAMAAMGIKEGGGWVSAEDYTPKYSAFIKIARMLVIRLAYVQREEMIEMKLQRLEERRVRLEAAGQVPAETREAEEKRVRDQTEGMFDIVRRKVQRYMTLVSDQSKPTPIDWIFESRSYGFKIRYTTAAEGVIDWNGDQIAYQDRKFTVNQIRDMIYGAVEEARRELMGLMMVDVDSDGDIDEKQVPPIDWDHLEDDHSEERVGWSFLEDIRNPWKVDGKWWLMRRVCEEEALRKAWLKEGLRDGSSPYQHPTVREYQKRLERFLELLLLIMHTLGGQPPRATEILGMRYCNSSNGGFRNILIHRGLVCFVAAYHKNYRSSEQVKIIHRYLPRAVGELLVWYLWLVLPFWQQVQVTIQEADEISPFVWADHVVEKEDKKDQGDEGVEVEPGEDRPPDMSEDEGYESSREFNFTTMHRSRKWVSERLRRIIQEYSVQWLGEELNISAWRHIAIGISNRFLRGDFRDDSITDIDLDGFDDDEDNPWDLQAGHGTHVAGMIYARLLHQDRMSTMSRQEKFRQVSRRWHRFLGFDSPAEGERKRKWEEFEEEGRELQYQRFKRLSQVNTRRKLQALMGEEARFRGNQEPAIQAIMEGESPVIQVTPTGGGKSLSFMLPAYCVPGGVTVVIAPLVSLKDDLQRRCEELQIDSTIWESQRPNRVASVVFVSPESAVSKTFSTFVNRLKGTFQLDRVVVDECHTVLDSGPRFRPKLQKLGRTLVKMCTQLVFLTATLPPRDEEEFCKAMRIPYRPGEPLPGLFRARTARKNIRYEVRESGSESEDEVVRQTVEQKLAQYSSGKIIVYCREITRGTQLSEILNCPFYHRNVDSQQGKAQRMKDWMDGAHRVMVATNALGLGVDIPDIRVVIHAGAPRKIRDYAQESGRAGRDRFPSESIIVCSSRQGGQPPHRRGWTDVRAIDMPDFIARDGCRRVIMDRIMDGRDDRQKCEEEEEKCDVCEEDERFRQGPFDDSGIGAEGSPESISSAQEGEDHLRARFERQERQRGWQHRQLVVEEQTAGVEVGEFRRYLEYWVGRCPWCYWNGVITHTHTVDACRRNDGAIIHEISSEIRAEIQDKRLFESFSCCVWCGVPQAICERWQARAEGGLWEEVEGGQCQYIGVLVPAVVAMLIGGEEGDEEVFRWMKDEGVEMGDRNAVGAWLGRRVEWGRIEATRLCQVFHYLAGLHATRVDY